jgi:hypothetical protein
LTVLSAIAPITAAVAPRPGAYAQHWNLKSCSVGSHNHAFVMHSHAA